jgi:hypothetical protein
LDCADRDSGGHWCSISDGGRGYGGVERRILDF